jgi:putative ABC transport system substrate-binding protein
MDRRAFLGALSCGLLAVPLVAEAQLPAKVPRVGALIHGSSPSPEQLARSPLRQGLHERGWIVGQTILIERVFSEGQPDRLADLAAELARRQVDVIWCNGPPSAVAAARATRTIPVVFWGVGFPVELGLVASLARPGGNITGLAHTPGAEIVAKLFELLKTIAPQTTRTATILEVSGAQKVDGDPFVPADIVDPALRALGIKVNRFFLEDRSKLDRLFVGIRDWKAEAILVVGDPLTWMERQRIVDFANRNRLPAVFGMKDFVVAGGLMSYGPNTEDTIRQSASYIDRILRGTKPSDLPVEQPTKFELVINLKTAKALGLTIPQSLLQRADQAIE